MPFSELIYDVFRFLLLVKVAGAGASAAVFLRYCGPGKAWVFWGKYWDLKYAGENVLDASVWLTTILGCLYSSRLLGGLGGIGMAAALERHPILLLGMSAALGWFAFSTVVQTLSCVRRTQALCHPPLLKKIGGWALQLSVLYLELSGWSEVLSVGQVGLYMILDRAIASRTQRMLERSALLLAVECAGRVAVVAAARYVVTGHLRFW